MTATAPGEDCAIAATHYFETYKLFPGSDAEVTIQGRYGRDHALDVVRASMEDYAETFRTEQE